MTNNKKKVVILGVDGMLGSMIYNVLQKEHNLILVLRDKKKLPLINQAYGGIDYHRVYEFDFNSIYDDYIKGFKDLTMNPSYQGFLDDLGEVDTIINCVGIITSHALKDPANTLFINSALPHILAQTFKEKLIHISTDCVFNGIEGFPYSEDSLYSPTDLYGLSKSLGEPQNCLTLRTSIIGPEIVGFFGLLEWFRKQSGKTVKGFTEHFWNGITTKEFGKICGKVIENRSQYPQGGLFHIFSTTLSKYEMLLKFQSKYNIDCKIILDNSTGINRTLATVRDLNSQLKVPSFDEMLEEL
jgi:dTDP-4-dehydrorhamnose reductase